MYHIYLQWAADKNNCPRPQLLRKWANAALKLSNTVSGSEVTIRIVDIPEMTELNETYRHKKGATNVLSFPFSVPDSVKLERPILGDIVICAPIVNQEAQEQSKENFAHWAHMIIHGVFHLLGHDHQTDAEAQIMESLEIAVLSKMGYSNPYETGDNIKNYG